MEIFDRVSANADVLEETQGSLDTQDPFFGTTVAPHHLIGWPVKRTGGDFCGALIIQRTSIRPFSPLEKKIVAGVAKRIGRYLSDK